MKKIALFCIVLFSITSCTQFSSEYKRTKLENDSLKLHIKKNQAEMNELISLLNVVEDDLQSINITEEILSIQKDSELSLSRREQMTKKINSISETLKKNRKKLAELQEKLNASSLNTTALQKSIDRLSKEMNEKGELIIKLRDEIIKKEVQIEELSSQIDELQAGVKELEELNLTHLEKINEQEQDLNTVYYCFGTKKELKEQNILTGGALFSKTKALQSDFKLDYFQTIDKRVVTSIPLFSSKATLKTNHPQGSYHFAKDTDSHLILEIDNVNVFWSLSNYLVVEVR